MKRLALPLLGLSLSLAALVPLRAGDPQALSLLIDKSAQSQGFLAVQTGGYVGGSSGQDHLVALPYYYYGTKQLFDWNLFDTPVEFDLGRSVQFSLRNIGHSAFSVGAGIAFNYASLRERSPGATFVPGSDMFTAAPYLFGRFQATKAFGIELSEKVGYNWFMDGQDAYRPKDYVQTETRLLLDFDLRDKPAAASSTAPRPREAGFYTGVYGFARQQPGDIYNDPAGAAFQQSYHSDGAYGIGTMTEYLWRPWASGNFGLVVEGEATANTDPVYLSETDNYRSRGYVYPHLLVNQDAWRGATVSAEFGPRVDYQRFGDANDNPSFLRASISLTQGLSDHLSVGLLYRYDGDPYKASYSWQDQTAPHYIAVTTSYRF